jgi:DNA-binding transcriptional regulator YiaG
MNDLQQLRERLADRFPSASLTIDAPALDNGTWFLDAELQGHLVVVQWRADRGFGITTPTRDDFNAKPQELYECLDAAYDRVVELLLSQARTIPGLTLPKLRELRGFSQTDIAQRLQINQGAVSRLERRGDMLVGTLRNLISAMGGNLKLIAEFPDRSVDIQIDQLLGA